MTEFDIISHLEKLIDFTPIIVEGDILRLIELEDIIIESDIKEYVLRVDEPSLVPNERIILTGPITNYYKRWPIIHVNKRNPVNLIRFNNYLFQNFDFAQKNLFAQSQIADHIADDIEVDMIILLLIDGLSYKDWIDFPYVSSCFVDGPTITAFGFRNIIGNPPIAYRLFNNGFKKRFGFTYWDRDNQLTDLLFFGFEPSLQLKRVSEFKEVLLGLDKLPLEQTYIQILINGLDYICHHHRGRPPIKTIAKELYERIFSDLVSQVQKMGATAIIYATADHGILWKPAPEENENLIVIKDDRVNTHRYAKGSFLIPNARHFTCYGKNYTSLAYPYLFKPLSRLERGVHGGISYQESVVPFVKMEVS